MRGIREEYIRSINQMGKEIEALIQNRKFLIAQEIEPGEEWGPLEIPEAVMKMRRIAIQKEMGQPRMEPPAYPTFER